MIKIEEDLEPSCSPAQSIEQQVDSTAFSSTGTQPELQFLASREDPVSRELPGLSDPAPLSPQVATKCFFVAQPWQHSYASALIETNEDLRAASIARAEHDIFGRYLELSASEPFGEEYADLQQAVDALLQLKQPRAGRDSISN